MSKDLLEPRVRVTSEYPGSVYSVGTVLYVNREAEKIRVSPNTIDSFATYVEVDLYPNIFKPMGWWEDRDITEMPQYVRFQDGGVFAPTHFQSSWGSKHCMGVHLTEISIHIKNVYQ